MLMLVQSTEEVLLARVRTVFVARPKTMRCLIERRLLQSRVVWCRKLVISAFPSIVAMCDAPCSGHASIRFAAYAVTTTCFSNAILVICVCCSQANGRRSHACGPKNGYWECLMAFGTPWFGQLSTREALVRCADHAVHAQLDFQVQITPHAAPQPQHSTTNQSPSHRWPTRCLQLLRSHPLHSRAVPQPHNVHAPNRQRQQARHPPARVR